MKYKWFTRYKSRGILRIEADRKSVCMSDDMYRHNKFFEFSDDILLVELIRILAKDDEYKYLSKSTIWAGGYDNFKCIQDMNGNWLVSLDVKAVHFFNDIEKYVFFGGGNKCEGMNLSYFNSNGQIKEHKWRSFWK